MYLACKLHECNLYQQRSCWFSLYLLVKYNRCLLPHLFYKLPYLTVSAKTSLVRTKI